MVSEAAQKRQKQTRAARNMRLIFYPAIAAALAIIMLVSVLPGAPAEAAGYYTVDINPSVSIAVDSEDNVLSASAKNTDAERVLSGLNLSGMRIGVALKAVIAAADSMGYIKDGGHVIIAHFGGGEGVSQKQAEEIVSLELPERSVKAVALNGTLDEFKTSEKAGKKAGIEALMQDAREAGIKGQDIDAVIGKMSGKDGAKPSGKDNNGKGNNGNAGGGKGSPEGDKDKKEKENKDKYKEGKDDKNKDKEGKDDRGKKNDNIKKNDKDDKEDKSDKKEDVKNPPDKDKEQKDSKKDKNK